MDASDPSVELLGIRFAQYIAEVRDVWQHGLVGPEAAESVRGCMARLLAEADADEPWIAAMLREHPRGRELYRDPDFGFIQMGHFHAPGHSTAPHDHGSSWVVYGVYSGAIEIPTFGREGAADDREARLRTLVSLRLVKGVSHAYLPGEIHGTRALADEGSVVLRFLSEDLVPLKRSTYSWSQVTTG